MKYFTHILTFMFSVVIIDLVGQTTLLTSKGKISTNAECTQSFFAYEENAEKIDSLTAVSTYKAVDEENTLILHVGSYAGDYYCYVSHNNDCEWYSAEVFFNTNGIYQIILRHPFDNSYLAKIDIGKTLQFDWSPVKGGAYKMKLGFSIYSCWSDLKETNCKSYYSLFYKPNTAPQKTN